MKNRVTFKESNGTWGLKNYDIQKVPGELYGAICKLKDYEETGFSPNDIELIKDIQDAAVQERDNIANRISQFLRDSGFEEASKEVDCEFTL